MIPHVSLFRNH